MSRPAPAASTAGPTAANTPAPIIDPRPITTASPSPRRRASRLGGSVTSSVCVVVAHQLDLDAARLREERRVHPGELAAVRLLARRHARRDELRVLAVDVVGAEADVAEVDLPVGGAAELDLQPRRRV